MLKGKIAWAPTFKTALKKTKKEPPDKDSKKGCIGNTGFYKGNIGKLDRDRASKKGKNREGCKRWGRYERSGF